MLGIWKDFDELESSLCLPEIVAILESARKRAYDDKVFFAKINGIDMEKSSVTKASEGLLNAVREAMGKEKEARNEVPANDITRLRGRKARETGFGIGMGLDYEVVDANGEITTG